MAFSVSNFRSKGMPGGGARPNLFSVMISGVGAGINIPGNHDFLCKIATIPPSTMGVVEVPYFGRMVKVPGNRTFDNLSVTFLNDENFAIRNAMELWMNKMNSHVGNFSENPEGLHGEFDVFQHARGGELEIGGGSWHFTNIFPVALGEIALDWGSNDTIEEYTVEWAYDYWSHGNNTG